MNTQIVSNKKIKGVKMKAFQSALPYTLPILAGFLFLGMTYGVYMNSLGFSFVYPMLMSMTIFAGSMEFVAGNLLIGAFSPLDAFLVGLMVNARHLFYGLSMLERFKGSGWKKFFLIFGMCDETFSINVSADIPEDVDRGWFMLFVTILNQAYWVSGATLGGIFGGFLPIDTEGISFVMTALFVVLFIEKWIQDKSSRSSGLLGLVITCLSLIVFGSEKFMLVAMAMLILLFIVLKQGRGGESK